jgi:hypothetical protein
MDVIDLTQKRRPSNSNHAPLDRLLTRLKQADNKTQFEADDIIELWGGYNSDIRYRARVLGVDGEDIYLNWNCYWFPIQDDATRKIELVKRP